MSSKHTPGSWDLWPEPDVRGEPSGSWMVSQPERGEDIAIVTANRDIPPEVAAANARLIAAAPELLAAVHAMRPLVELLGAKMDGPKHVTDTLEAVHRLLAKVEGGGR